MTDAIQPTPLSTAEGAVGRHLDLLDWVLLHRPLLVPDRPFDIDHHPYLADIYRCRAQSLVIDKASQMGASEYLISYALHAADARGATILYIMPNDLVVGDFSSGRIAPALEASPYLTRRVIEGDERGADRVKLKRVGNRFLYLRGGVVSKSGRAPQLRSVDADIVIFDEVDEIDPRALALGRKRLRASFMHETRYVSTPTYAGIGIEALWQVSDKRQWHVRCDHCGERQPLSIDDLITDWDDLDRPIDWHGRSNGEAWIVCRHCAQPLDRRGAGEWVAEFPTRPTAGFHLSRLFAIDDLHSILDGLRSDDMEERRQAWNQDLGLPFAMKGGQLTDADLDECRADYSLGAVKGEATVMGIDVGGRLHVIIRARPHVETGQMKLRYVGAVSSWDTLTNLIIDYNVTNVVIDGQPETTKAREIQSAVSPDPQTRRVWLCFYHDQPAKASVYSADPQQGNLNADRTRSLDDLFASLRGRALLLPREARDIPDYYDHLKAPQRVIVTNARGEQVARYIEGNEADHFAHAENYCLLAMRVPLVSFLPTTAGRAKVTLISNL